MTSREVFAFLAPPDEVSTLTFNDLRVSVHILCLNLVTHCANSPTVTNALALSTVIMLPRVPQVSPHCKFLTSFKALSAHDDVNPSLSSCCANNPTITRDSLSFGGLVDTLKACRFSGAVFESLWTLHMYEDPFFSNQPPLCSRYSSCTRWQPSSWRTSLCSPSACPPLSSTSSPLVAFDQQRRLLCLPHPFWAALHRGAVREATSCPDSRFSLLRVLAMTFQTSVRHGPRQARGNTGQDPADLEIPCAWSAYEPPPMGAAVPSGR